MGLINTWRNQRTNLFELMKKKEKGEDCWYLFICNQGGQVDREWV
jgi:hypothetical protein